MLRAKLYGDIQAPIVQVQQTTVGKQLADADTALQAFKQQHDISNFSRTPCDPAEAAGRS